MILYGIIGVVALVVLFILFISTYKVVEPNEAHVTIFMGRGRKFYGPMDGAKTAYFFIPVIMKRYILPLTNVKIDINEISLNDMNVAPFVSDVITWVRIKDPVLAAERLNLTAGAFASLRDDLVNIVQAIARAAAMKQELLDIMKDRKTFSASVSAEVEPVLKEWGVELVNLEVNDIADEEGSSVISDYESMREAQVKSKARIEIAERNREAVESEQQNYQLSQIATAVAQEASEKRFVEKVKVVGISTQEQERDVAEAEELANKQKVSAIRTLEVGTAAVAKEAAIEKATGEGEATRILGEKDAEVIRLTGNATANAIQAKGEAEAVAQSKLAEALKQFNEAATVIEKIKTYKEIQIAMAEAYGKVAENAEIKVVSGGGEGMEFLGIPMNGQGGAGFAQFMEGLDTEALLAVASNVKEIVAPKKS